MTARRPRIVYVFSFSPYPPEFGGALRAACMLRALRSVGDVQFVLLGDKPAQPWRRQLRSEGAWLYPSRREGRVAWAARCLRALLTGASIPAARFLSGRRVRRLTERLRALAPDAIVLGDGHLGSLAGALRPVGARIVIDTHNADSRLHWRIAAASRRPFEKVAFALLALNTWMVERRAFPRADQVWAVSPDDARYYEAVPGVGEVPVVPNVIDLERYAVSGAGEAGVVAFVGSFDYPPNAEAALRLVEAAEPLAAAGRLRQLLLVGRAPTPAMHAAASGRGHVVVTGRVEDVRPWVERAAVVAAPLASGSGTKLKVLEAMAMGKAILTTPVGAEGLAVEPGVQLALSAPDAAPFSAALGALLADEERQRALGAAARAWVEANLAYPVMEARVRELLAAR